MRFCLALLLFSACAGPAAPASIDGVADSRLPEEIRNEAETVPPYSDVIPAHDLPGADLGDLFSQETTASCLPKAPEGPMQVGMESGVVAGHDDGGVLAFLGIPYADAPVGELRWRPPTPAPCLDGVLEATEFGPSCPQMDAKSGDPIGSEDCLTLNVWTPATDGARPVLFFVHGGGNIQGASSVPVVFGTKPLYGGSHLTNAHEVVVVTVNYRLGTLGFLALPELSAESGQGISGNYGLLDIIAALQWTQRNIAAFGGDPSRVMIFGESAGAVNTCTLLASPLAKGLFSRALMQSGLCTGTPLATAAAGYSDYVTEQTGCVPGAERLNCLRAMAPAALLTAMPPTVSAATLEFGFSPTAYGPIVDGYLLPEPAAARVEAGQFNDVPVVLGSNADEYHSLLGWPVPTANAYTNIVENALGWLGQDVVDQALSLYPVGSYDSPRAALVDLLTDSVFTCPARQWARRLATNGSSSVFSYYFTRKAVTKQGRQPAAHGMELLYVFGSMVDIPFFTPAPADAALSEAMMGYWTRFAAAGDPNNGGNAADWPAFDSASESYLRLDADIEMGTHLKSDKCDFWDALQGG